MYKVIDVFQDKYTSELYAIGDNFTSDDESRVKDLLKRKLIEGVAIATPSFNDLTKKELVKLLDQEGIEYNKRMNKEELIELLQKGSD